MKKVILWIILMILIISCFLISYLKFFYSKPVQYVSYELKNYNSTGALEGRGVNENFSLELNFAKKNMTFCIINLNKCSSYRYMLKDSKYYISSKDKMFLDGKLEFNDSFTNKADDIITFNVNFEGANGGITIISFKKSDSIDVENARN